MWLCECSKGLPVNNWAMLSKQRTRSDVECLHSWQNQLCTSLFFCFVCILFCCPLIRFFLWRVYYCDVCCIGFLQCHCTCFLQRSRLWELWQMCSPVRVTRLYIPRQGFMRWTLGKVELFRFSQPCHNDMGKPTNVNVLGTVLSWDFSWMLQCPYTTYFCYM